MKTEKAHDLDKFIRLALLSIVSIWTFQLIFPLIGILTWGFILAVTFYPIYKWLNGHFDGRSTMAASLIIFVALFVFIGVIVLLSNNMANSLRDIIDSIHAGRPIIPPPSSTIENWPFIGKDLYRIWSLASSNISEVVNQYREYLINAGSVTLVKVAHIGADIIIFVLSILFSGYLMVCGPRVMQVIRKLGAKIAPEHGANLIKTMKETIQNISRGVIGISIVQAVFFGLVILYAGVPVAGFLTFLAFFMSLLQVGLIFLVIPILLWVFSTLDYFQAAIIFILLVLVVLTDTFLKPFVFARGLRTPMMIIFFGVIGGIMTYGFIGIFIGPVVLALFYDLMSHWLQSH